MKKLYSDRDYFDEKFSEIDKKFTIIETKIDKVYACIYGNGEEGLIDKVREQGRSIIWMIWTIATMITFLVITHLKDVTDFIIELFEKRM